MDQNNVNNHNWEVLIDIGENTTKALLEFNIFSPNNKGEVSKIVTEQTYFRHGLFPFYMIGNGSSNEDIMCIAISRKNGPVFKKALKIRKIWITCQETGQIYQSEDYFPAGIELTQNEQQLNLKKIITENVESNTATTKTFNINVQTGKNLLSATHLKINSIFLKLVDDQNRSNWSVNIGVLNKRKVFSP